MRKVLLYFNFCVCVAYSFGQQVSTSKPSLNFGAFLDTYYAYSLNEPTSQFIDYAYNHSRHNEFNVNLALVSAKYTATRVRANVALQAGTYPLYNYAAEPSMLQHIYDANVGVNLCKHLWLDAGIFGSSHIGFESAISKDNWTLTRSMSAENTPYYASGAELNYEPSEKLLISLLVTNGWQNIKDNNSNKAVGYQLTWKPNSKFGFNTSSFFGEAYNLPDSMTLMRYFNHAYLYFHPSSKISLALLCDVGIQQTKRNGNFDGTWVNPTLLLKVTPSKKWAFCYRAEYYDDKDKLIFTSTPGGVVFKTFGSSLNFDYTGIDNVMLRLEGKYFSSENEVYYTKNGLSTTNTIITASVAWWFQ
ncbi:MAG: porin [Bacteroidia bacterium]